MKTIWYIRHGESMANAGFTTSSPAEIPLTDKGHIEAQKASSLFIHAPGLIVTSPYLRARQTASYTANKFPSIPFEEWRVEEFTYLSPERCKNTTTHERRPVVIKYWEDANPDYMHGEDAESFRHFMTRVQDMQNRLQSSEEKFIAVFSHGFVIKAALWANLQQSFEATSDFMSGYRKFDQSFDFPNCGIVEGRFIDNHWYFGGIIKNPL